MTSREHQLHTGQILRMVSLNHKQQLQELTEIDNFKESPPTDKELVLEETMKDYIDLFENPHLNIAPSIRAVITSPSVIQINVRESCVSCFNDIIVQKDP